jgi:RNA polymerase sigma factor (sigma-70 family)
MGKSEFGLSREDIVQALTIFFRYAERREPAARQIPREVLVAFDVIVDYYTTRLKNVVKVFPGESLARFCDAQDLYFHAWGKLWREGHTIKSRTPAGVCAWLKMVVRNHRINLQRKLSSREISGPWNENERESRLDQARHEMEDCGLIPPLSWPDEVYFRYRLLSKLVREALTKLNDREQEVLRFTWRGRTLAEIMRLMQFNSLNAASSFKKRALEKLAKRLYLLFLREYDRPGGDLHAKEVIEEWKERFHQQRENKRCVIRA